MNINLYVDKLNMSLNVGIVDILLPSYGMREFGIFEDLAELFKLETNYEAERLLKQRIKEKGIQGKVDFDSESDYVSIASKKGQIILEVAIVINELANQIIEKELVLEFMRYIDNWKMPKKQIWGVGDIFSIPISDGTFYFAQIIDLVEGVTPIIVIFDSNLDRIPDKGTIEEAKILAVLSIVSDKLDDFFFKVVMNTHPLAEIPAFIRRDPIRNIQHSGQTIIEFCQAIMDNEKLDKFDEFLGNVEYLL